ncbi:hypothetical protein AJ80_08091 [Polytolypa hystricis UAMH7299]|uniref:Ribosome quality control complex subunit 2 n=1 Tax=Polytolypa hystricis (strain UAMH7299) TaxID=1447883 RepID=A0A2B7XDT9_POLH7|nr:hypothetical protein AJ80_08091 [Polytolypa hystricis UAMH7299]
MKQRFSSLDVKVISRELSKTIVGLRISNIYDLSSRIYLFKLAKPDVRKQLIVDAGFRCHLTEFSRTTAAEPSPFVARLRKFLKTRRITAVSQVGTDRIIHFEFSEGTYHLFLEFFAAGNIILTDNEYNIIALHRIVPPGDEQDEVRIGLTYSLTNKQNYNGVPSLSMERLTNALEKAKTMPQPTGETKRAKRKQAEVLRRALSYTFPEYPPALLDHAFHVAGFDSALKPDEVLADPQLVEKLLLVLKEAENVNLRLSTMEEVPGYIIAQVNTKQAPASPDEASSEPKKLAYQDFHPFEPMQFKGLSGTEILNYDTFNKAVDEFFSSIESQKLESRLTEREQTAKRKLEAAKRDHEKRIGALQEAQELHIRKAQAIEANFLRVEEAMNAVNGLIAQGMDWVEIARLIEMEQAKQNPVAKVVKLPLKLYENTVTLLLSEPSLDEDEYEDEEASSSEEEEESDSEEEGASAKRAPPPVKKPLSIDIDLGITPWANARQYYEQKKQAAVKEEKTLKSSKKALKSTERKVTTDLKQSLKQEKPVLRPARTPFWFEKFIYFVSSDGYLVIGGKDAQQAEILYLRHLKKGDIYVHSDVEGAVPMIVKNKPGTPDAPIPPGTLSQAGTLSVATSTAWDSKAVMGAWWVKAPQVSKTTSSGEYLASGGFLISGEKNFLAPAQLILGFAVIFQISEESVKNHTKHRVLEEQLVEESAAELAAGEAGEDVNVGTEKEAEPIQEPSAGQENVEDVEDEGSEQGHDSDGEDDADDDADQSANPLLAGKLKEINNGSPSDEEAEEEDEEVSEETRHTDTQKPTHEETNGTPEQQDTTAKPRGAKHLSAHERRLLKKGITIEPGTSGRTSTQSDDAISEPASPPSTTEPSRASTPSQAPPTTTKPTAPNVRGKRGKAKKMATKYMHQDEEDRELALRLLGAGPQAQQHKAAEAAKTKAQRDAEMEVQKQRRRAQHDRAAKAERQRQEALRAGGKGGAGANEDDEDEKEDLSCIRTFVGGLVAGDEVIAAIPVCAPWSAVGQYKYRAKLQPGPMKKGKAVKEVLGKWVVDATAAVNAARKASRQKLPPTTTAGEQGAKEEGGGQEDSEKKEGSEGEKLAAVELELIKGWRDVEVVNTLPVGKVRVISSGGGGSGGGKGDIKGKGKGGGGGGRGKPGKGSKRR